jgi:PKD repeat protein
MGVCSNRRRRLVPVVLGLGILLVAAKAFDPDKSPAVAVPASRYAGGQLVPAAILGDTTSFDLDSGVPTAAEPFWHDLDIENDILFAATGHGLEIYDISPRTPVRLASLAGQDLAPLWSDHRMDFYLTSLDVVDSDAALVVTAAREQGLIVWNLADLEEPSVHYQDSAGFAGINASEVYTATLRGTPYAFVPESGGDGVHYYDLAAAARLDGCLESSRAEILCPDVYQGLIFNTEDAFWIHGVGEYLAIRSFEQEVTLLDVSDPSRPVLQLSGRLPESAHQVAMWEDTRLASGLYLAAVGDQSLWIYDLTCLRDSQCAGLPAPLITVLVPNLSAADARQRFLTVSQSNGASYLYVGNDTVDTLCVAQREYLFDVTAASTPREITPQVDVDGYWGWYYDACFLGTVGGPGFNNVRPRRGKVAGETFYRAAFSVLDSHRMAEELEADFLWTPATPFVGDPVEFTDLSVGDPDSWSWDFPGGGEVDSLERNPIWVFDTAGPQDVTLTVAGPSGSSSLTETITLIDPPPPPVASFIWFPLLPEVGETVTLIDTSTGGPDAWYWSFEDASRNFSQGSLRIYRVQTLRFLSTGKKAVELWAANDNGAGYVLNLIQVVPPEPVIEEIVVDAVSAPRCSQVTFTTTVTGRAPLDYAWSDPLFPMGVASTRSNFTWDIRATAPGLYSTTLTVTNALGTASLLSPTVSVTALQPIQISSAGTLIEEIRGSRVEMRLETKDATEWIWDWGDGTTPADEGSNPTHFYATDGNFPVTVRVSNCVEGPLVVPPVGVTVAPFEALAINIFEALCPLGVCFFSVHEAVVFEHEVSGFPYHYDYDWDGNGSFEETSEDPILAHAYNRIGNYRPILRVRRGRDVVQLVNPGILYVRSAP